MRKLNKPNFDVKTIVNECSESFIDSIKKSNYKKSSDFIELQSDKYDTISNEKSWEKIKPHNKVNNILSKEDMEKLYTEKFAKHYTVRSKYYDKIIINAEGRCPICGISVVSNLDHYLAKSMYPTYAVTPFNLIPICRECNYNKKDKVIDSVLTAPLHPYYDYVDDNIWLIAKLKVENGRLVALYYINEDIEEENISLYKRLSYHFKLYKLDRAYSVQSSTEIAENTPMWKKNYALWGEDKLKLFLKEQLASCEEYQKNTWKTAMIRALIKDTSILLELQK